MKTQSRNHIWIIVTLFLLIFPLPGSSQSTETQEKEARVLFERAEQALRNNKPKEASDGFQEVLRLDPGNVEARVDLGVIEFFAGNYPKAAQDFREGLKLRPSLWKIQALLGMCEKRLGHFAEAQALLESSFSRLEDEKVRLRAGMDLVEIDYREGELTKAAEVLTVLQRLNPADVDVLYTSSRIYTELAFRAAESLAMVAPDSARMHQLLAERLINNGELGDAVAEYRKAIQLDSKLPGIHYELGEAIVEQSTSQPSLEKAEAEFNAELAINPNDPKVECKLGQIYSLRSDLKAALEHYSRASQLNPNEAGAQLGLGEVLARMGRQEEAFKCYLAAERLDPLNETAHYHLATIYRRLGQKADADREMAAFKRISEVKRSVDEAFGQMHKRPSQEMTVPDSSP